MGKRNEANSLRKKLAKKCQKNAKITINLEFVTKYFLPFQNFSASAVLALHDIENPGQEPWTNLN